ncbi:hypothetical protein [Bradyrhizobium macuxiense]|uniref:hypothetical protein n=1 Tax=Bradyrhizobium macuxiense TaxID=1755647 RepID=UPI001365AA03|nr:hypothetical protein [Bradyrhizobium macuxiense]
MTATSEISKPMPENIATDTSWDVSKSFSPDTDETGTGIDVEIRAALGIIHSKKFLSDENPRP